MVLSLGSIPGTAKTKIKRKICNCEEASERSLGGGFLIKETDRAGILVQWVGSLLCM